MKKIYNKNKQSKVGDECVCPSCETVFIKTNYQQAFCTTYGGTVCKDKYWNTVTPKKRNNTTRISPANRSFMKNNGIGIYRPEPFYDDDPSWDAHKDSF